MNIYIEANGMSFGEESETFFHLYTVDKSCEKGHGIKYNSIGKPYTFAWCHPCKECVLPDDLKRKFMYSFKHGSSDIAMSNELLKDGADFWNLLRDKRNYEYKWVSRKEVETQKKIEALEINTKEDVMANKDLLFNNNLSHKVVCKVLAAFGVQPTQAHNGEIGIAAMADIAKFSVIRDCLTSGNK